MDIAYVSSAPANVSQSNTSRSRAFFALLIGLATAAIITVSRLGAQPVSAQTTVRHAPGDLISATPFDAPAVSADAQLLVRYMLGIHGDMIRASSLLFVPRRSAPPAGRPIVAWAHGTTTPGKETRAQLDGDIS